MTLNEMLPFLSGARAYAEPYRRSTTLDRDPDGIELRLRGKTFGRQIVWTEFGGDKVSVAVSGCADHQEAFEEALRLATMDGWTPPRWWQFWRWGDTRVTV